VGASSLAAPDCLTAAAKAALVAIEADLRVQRMIDAPELNPVAARANTITVDVTIASPVGASILAKAAAEQGAAARAAEARKDAHYRKYFPADGANVDILAIETFGFISDKSQATLEKIARLASGIPLSADLQALKTTNKRLYNIYVINLARLRERVSVALWQGNAYALDKMLSKWSGVAQLRFAHALPFEGPVFPNGLLASYNAGLAAAALAEADAAPAE
jgi:multisubunit Na+/H+ antiporter MnhG subunit